MRLILIFFYKKLKFITNKINKKQVIKIFTNN